MADITPPGDVDAERNLLGAMLVTECAGIVLGETPINAELFSFTKHAEIFAAIVALHERGKGIDPLTVAAELRERDTLQEVGGRNYLLELQAQVAVPSHAVEYAKTVVQEAEWALRTKARHLLGEAIKTRDKDKLIKVEALLAEDLTHANADFEPAALRDRAYEVLQGNAVEAFPLPFPHLNNLLGGGIRRGNLIVIGGHTSHGKSVFADSILEHIAKHKPEATQRLYMNEMDLDERVVRTLNRRTGIPYSKIMAGGLSDTEQREANQALQDGQPTFPFGITLCAGWSAAEIAFHIRRKRWDVVVLDILHLIEHREERDLAEISATLNRTAKIADCVIIATVHLNENRVNDIKRPRPTIGDIRGSGSLKNDADVVAFVYRDQDEKTGDPLPEGLIYFSKARGGKTGGQPVVFEEDWLRFILPPHESEQAPMHVGGLGAP